MGIGIALGITLVLLGLSLVLLPVAALRRKEGVPGADRRYRACVWTCFGLLGAMLGLAWLNSWVLSTWRMHVPLAAPGPGPATVTIDPGTPMTLCMDWGEIQVGEGFLRSLSLVGPSSEREPLFPEDEPPGLFLVRTPATLAYVLGTSGEVEVARRTTLTLTRWTDAHEASFLFGLLKILALFCLFWILVWIQVGRRRALPPFGP